MELKQPILFHTMEELQEAVEYGIIRKTQIALYAEKEYSLPTLFWNFGNGKLDHQGDNKVLLDQNDEFLPILRKSVDWKDVREQYKPKEWYELESSVGKLVHVGDKKDDIVAVDTFLSYNSNHSYPFKCTTDYWKYATPVTIEHLITT